MTLELLKSRIYFKKMKCPIKFLLPLLIFCGMIIICYSAVFYEHQKPLSDHDGECYDAETEQYYQKGEYMSWNKKECGQKICRGSDGTGRVIIDYYSCGKSVLPPGCHLDVNLELSYPKCCGKLNCTQKKKKRELPRNQRKY